MVRRSSTAFPLKDDEGGEEGTMKWRSNTPDGDLLRDMMSSGEIKVSDTPKEVWAGRDEFKKYNLDSFRGGFTRAKQFTGIAVRPDGFPTVRRSVHPDDDDDRNDTAGKSLMSPKEHHNPVTNTLCPDAGEKALKKRCTEKPVEAEGASLFGGENATGEPTGVFLPWSPVHYMVPWEDSKRRKCVTITLLLPGTIGYNSKAEGLAVQVNEAGNVLFIQFAVPSFITASDLMFEDINMSSLSRDEAKDLFLKIAGFERKLAEIQGRVSERVISMAKIPLPFVVCSEMKVQTFKPANKEGRGIMIDLVAPSTQFKKLDLGF